MCKENEGGKAFELMEGLVQEAAVLKSIFLLWDVDVPLEEPGKGGKDGRVTLAELLGELIWEELSNCLIHSCLVHSVPTSSSQLEQYKEVGPKNPLRLEHRAQALQCDVIPVVNALQNLVHPLLSALIPNFNFVLCL